MQSRIEKDPRNAERIFPYIGGEEVNDSPTHAHHRYVINFEDMSEEEAREGWPDLLAIVEEKVKPERDKLKDNPDGRRRRTYWWNWGRNTPALYRAIAPQERVLVGCRVTKHVSFAKLNNSHVFDVTINVVASSKTNLFATLQSRVHDVWARFFASSLEDRLRYTPSDCFETFPFPPDFEIDPVLEAVGEAYYRYRAELMVARDNGLTKTYNDFHDRAKRDPETLELRRLHHAMDVAVLRAYGWDDLAERAQPVFLDTSNEDEFAYQGRLFWPSAFRDEVLARLLALNATRHAEEVRQGIAPGRGGRTRIEDVDDA